MLGLRRNMAEGFSFCPICQLPLKAILIKPDYHVSQCMKRCEENNEECPDGVECLSTNIFHYRDYKHQQLAAYRASADFVPPDIEIKPLKKRQTPRKSPNHKEPGRSSRNNRTPSRTKQKSSDSKDSESDSEVLIPSKRVCKALSFTKNCLPPNKNVSSRKTENVKSCRKSAQSGTENNKSTAEEVRNDNKKKNKTNSNSKKHSAQNNLQNLSVSNINLASCKEVLLRASLSASSDSVSATAISRVDDSDHEDESMTQSKSSTCGAQTICNLKSTFNLKRPLLKVGQTDTGQMKDWNDFGTINETADENLIHSCHFERSSGASTGVHDNRRGESSLLPIGVHCDTKSITAEDKRNERSTLTTLKSFTNVNGCGDNDLEIIGTMNNSIQVPSSPEVGISSANRKNHLLNSASSSDSDLPLFNLIRNRTADTNKDLTMVGNERGRELLKKSNHKLKGKLKAGKILRASKITLDYLNTPLEKDVCSDADVNSLKSFISKGNSSHVPSDYTSLNSSSTDVLTPLVTYSSTSSEMSSYPGSRDTVSVRHKSRNTQVRTRNVRKPVLPQSDSNSGVSYSDISKKEEMLFGRKTTLLRMKIKDPFNNVQCDNVDSEAKDKSKWQALIYKMRDSCFPSDLKVDSEDSPTQSASSDASETSTLVVPQRQCSTRAGSYSSSSDTSHTSTNILFQRQCPFYKRIPDTPFAVDAFQFWNIPGVKVYFLSHFHSDHYIGIKKSFAQPIYCSKVTARLVHMKLRVEERWLRVLELNSPQVICGVEVTALDANHCPGSFMFLFSLRNGKNYLHVGDFRASKAMTFHPSLQRISISKLFLDTTYCSPQYCFPTQEEVIGKIIDIVRNHVKNHPQTLVACGSYTIGKEKVFLGVAEALDWQVWARPEKQRVFACLSEPRISSRLVRDPRSANVHVLPMQSIQVLPLKQHLQSCFGTFTHVIGVKPTGWELDPRSQQFKVTTRDNITVYGVPYSEHSSFTELRDFVQFLQPQEIVPTVNVASAASREKMNKHFSEWLGPQDCRSKAGNQTKVSQFFKQSGCQL